MVVNDDAGHLTPRGVLGCIASMLAPTVDLCGSDDLCLAIHNPCRSELVEASNRRDEVGTFNIDGV